MTARTPDVTSPSGSSRLLRQINERAALGCFFLRGTLTRPELVELTGFSKPTASEVIRRLEAAGLVRAVGRTIGGPGPRADVYAVDPDARYGVAVSLREPDSLGVAVVDLTGEIRHRSESRPRFPESGLADWLAEQVRGELGAAALPVERLARVQVAVPGSYHARHDVVTNVDIPGCREPGLRAATAAALGTAVVVDNDVNLATLAERHHGAGGDCGFALLWLGERGIGLGIDLGGGLLHGHQGAAGELGYLPVTGRADGGTLQDLAGGPAVLALAREAGCDAESAEAAVRWAVEAGDTGFLAALADRLTAGLTAVAAVVDPAVIVLAGEVGRAGGPALAAALSDALAETAFGCPVVPSTVAGDTVLSGAVSVVAAGLRDGLLGASPGGSWAGGGQDQYQRQQ
ncbi:putative NBD/HSP70 family sugar kinase [Stackebrandtia albiflava]|uniref:Putative NBD/HSP70 family sugar kinase n=1 Tax=Stackebrandtia albiflava TaxID=406432 RepID=A0A562V9W1_9ACTN|nr:ROK family protein [Stackebrandtia albiflava]TWJ14643.1 putative NBD/HSP70 family sugar kinase [Stackebrandtia albiflava]